MAPSSPPNAAARKPSHLSVITDAIHKKDGEMPTHIRARQMSAPTVITHDAWAIGLDEDTVERPEDLCELSGDDWDLESACWSGDGCAAADATLVLSLVDAASSVSSVWYEACESTEGSGGMLPLLGANAAPSSAFEDDAAGFWAVPVRRET